MFRIIFLGKYVGVLILNASGHVQKERLMKTLRLHHCYTALITVDYTEITFCNAAF